LCASHPAEPRSVTTVVTRKNVTTGWRTSPRRPAGMHLRSGAAVGTEAGPWMGSADTPVDPSWFDRYEELKAAADEALAAANEAWSRWVARTKHL
jgi:hypothetical protein